MAGEALNPEDLDYTALPPAQSQPSGTSVQLKPEDLDYTSLPVTSGQPSQPESFETKHGNMLPSKEDSASLKNIFRETVNQGLPAAMGYGASALTTAAALGMAPETGGLSFVALPGASTAAGIGGFTAGHQLARIINHAVLGDMLPSNISQLPTDLMKSTYGQILGENIGGIPEGVSDLGKLGVSVGAKVIGGSPLAVEPKPNAVQIQEAGENVLPEGTQIPKAVISSNPQYQKTERGLSESGTLPAYKFAKAYRSFWDGMKAANNDIEDINTGADQYRTGDALKKDLIDEITTRKNAVNALYKGVSPQLRRTPVDAKTINDNFDTLKGGDLFGTDERQAYLEKWRTNALAKKDLNSLNELKKSVPEEVPGNAPQIDKKLAGQVYNALDSSVKSSATASGNPDLAAKLQEANDLHSSHLEDYNSIKNLFGNNDINSPGALLDKLQKTTPEKVFQRASNLDADSLQAVKDRFPYPILDKVKTAKLNDLVQGSSPNGEFSFDRFIKKYSSPDFSQAEKNMLFNPDLQAHINDLDLLNKNKPENPNPSKTTTLQMLMGAASPTRNALDLALRLGMAASNQTNKLPVGYLSQGQPSLFGAIKSAVPALASPLLQGPLLPKALTVPLVPPDFSGAKSGPKKWAFDGYNNLLQHGADASLLPQAFADEKGKDLLIRASDAKPGTKAMDNIQQRLERLMPGTGYGQSKQEPPLKLFEPLNGNDLLGAAKPLPPPRTEMKPQDNTLLNNNQLRTERIKRTLENR
jgi:hypothetical protein